MHENMKTSMWHTGRSERTCRLPACFVRQPDTCAKACVWPVFGFAACAEGLCATCSV